MTVLKPSPFDTLNPTVLDEPVEVEAVASEEDQAGGLAEEAALTVVPREQVEVERLLPVPATSVTDS